MSLKDHIIRSNALLFGSGIRLAEGISDEQSRLRIDGQANPPLWQFGHLLFVANSTLKMLGQASVAKDEVLSHFAPGGHFDPEGDHLHFEKVVELFGKAHDLRIAAFAAADDAMLDREFPRAELRHVFPTIGDAVVFLMTSHEAYHFAQVAGWRRAAGIPVSA